MKLPCVFKRLLSRSDDFAGLTVMQRTWRKQADAAVVMLVVVPVEKTAAERQAVFVAAEAFREFRSIFHRLKLAF